MTEPAHKTKRKQLILAGGIASVTVLMLGALLWTLGSEGVFESAKTTDVKETNIVTAGQRINPQEVWVARVEAENKVTQEKLSGLEKMLDENIKSMKKIEDNMGDNSSGNKSCTGVSDLGHEERDESINSLPPLPAPISYPNSSQENSVPPGSIGKITLKLSSRILPGSSGHGKQALEKSTLENTLPAGTFAKAILLGGVDASTSVSSSSDPRPVLLRVTDHGTLPRKFKSDLKDCHILASSYGDLSSERVFMRLEKLTCTERLTGEISETQVSGYIVGEDGKTGVRGVVADKAGPLVRNSLVGGFFSGLGQFFSAQQQRSTVFPVTIPGQIPAISPQQMLMSGASQGVSNAFEKYAEFFIKRAEQLQPVLQIAAGREVDVVFTQGTKFGETSVRKSLSKIRDRSRKAALQDLEESSDPQNWIPNNPQDGEEE